MKPAVCVSVLLAVIAVALAAPAPELKQSAETSSAISAGVASSQISDSGSVETVRDKKAAPCDDPTTTAAKAPSSSPSSASSGVSQDLSIDEERHKGVKLVPVQAPVTKTKFITVPVAIDDFGGHDSHSFYGGHREDSWSQQNSLPEQQRFSYSYDPELVAFQRASEQNMAAAEMAARTEWQARAAEQNMAAQEMAARAEWQVRASEQNMAAQEMAARAEWQARAAEQQLAADALRAEMVAKAQAQARADLEARAEIIAQQKQIQLQQQQALEAQRMHMELAQKQAIDEAQMQQQAEESSARSAYAYSSVPLSGGYSGYGGSAAAYFPQAPFSRNCGGIPLMFGCSPTLVRGILAGGHGYGGGAVASFGTGGSGFGGGYQSGGFGYGGGYKEAEGEVAVRSGRIAITPEEQSALMNLLNQLKPDQQVAFQQMIEQFNLNAN